LDQRRRSKKTFGDEIENNKIKKEGKNQANLDELSKLRLIF
jgi:hypothetical protein